MSLRHSVHPLRDSERHTTSLRASPTSLRTSHYVTQNIPYVTQSVTLRHSEHPIRDSEHLTTSLRASPTWLRTSHYVTQSIPYVNQNVSLRDSEHLTTSEYHTKNVSKTGISCYVWYSYAYKRLSKVRSRWKRCECSRTRERIIQHRAQKRLHVHRIHFLSSYFPANFVKVH